ncbi:GNAT family N-acetyltransferase [Aestuariivivens sediminis]|uniref:GNAT family N-acetyltransferase n=1 Tax=Aestuariivivens sediminis TaxID=2913557 RepID=UPI001F5AC402|nr:GNAT family N-acetyltransferase [Aestuariivivens sediminis]
MKTVRIYKSYDELPEHWNQLGGHDLFLQTPYLKALEQATPKNMQCFYMGVFKNEDLVGIAIIQHVRLYLKEMFRKTPASRLRAVLRDMVSRGLKGQVLVVGNLTHTGQHALCFDANEITQADYFELIFKGLQDLTRDIKKTENKTIRAIIVKDFFIEDPIIEDPGIFRRHKLNQVKVQPNMMLFVDDRWLTMEDYIADLNKKYRDRYKRARRKFNGIIVKELDIETIQKNSKVLHQLYLNVSNNARFNTFVLPENHFYSLKLQLKSNFRVYGYFLDQTLVGFYTLILNGKHLETYFLGYDAEHQYPNQLYLNMLYDMLEFGIENRFSTIVYARTAMAIKSSVGAKPIPMVMYLKHTNPILNAMLYPVFKLMNPTQNWKERHPFIETN